MEQKHYGIYRAVVEDNRDPDKLRRLKVSIPQITGRGKDQKTGWIWPIISTERPPAVGSGVWVMYLGGDPDYPVWVGEFAKKPQGLFAYGSWYDTTDQTNAINTAKAITFNSTSTAEGIDLKSSSRMTVQESGTYNIQFSAQIHNTGGGGSGELMYIWFRKNGVDIPNSATSMHVSSNQYRVMTVNIFEKLKANDYIQIYWSTTNTAIRLEHLAAGSPQPAVPSVIVTMNQVA